MKRLGVDLFALLVSLYADQEGVEIKYELEEKEDVRRVPKVAV